MINISWSCMSFLVLFSYIIIVVKLIFCSSNKLYRFCQLYHILYISFNFTNYITNLLPLTMLANETTPFSALILTSHISWFRPPRHTWSSDTLWLSLSSHHLVCCQRWLWWYQRIFIAGHHSKWRRGRRWDDDERRERRDDDEDNIDDTAILDTGVSGHYFTTRAPVLI